MRVDDLIKLQIMGGLGELGGFNISQEGGRERGSRLQYPQSNRHDPMASIQIFNGHDDYNGINCNN